MTVIDQFQSGALAAGVNRVAETVRQSLVDAAAVAVDHTSRVAWKRGCIRLGASFHS